MTVAYWHITGDFIPVVNLWIYRPEDFTSGIVK